ncbi:MAG: tRNA-binding protein [Acidobacteriota bacterium]
MIENEFKAVPVKPAITITDLEKIDIRVGTIVAVEEVSGSDKLVRLIVDFGDHQRSVLAGMKEERANPQAIAGAQALFVVNLEPRKMMGELSEGMLFDIGYADGIQPVLAVPESKVPNGARAG